MTDGRLLLRAVLISTEDTIQKLDLLWEFCLQEMFIYSEHFDFLVSEVFVSKSIIFLQFSTLYLNNVKMPVNLTI